MLIIIEASVLSKVYTTANETTISGSIRKQIARLSIIEL